MFGFWCGEPAACEGSDEAGPEGYFAGDGSICGVGVGSEPIDTGVIGGLRADIA